jgi:hypothetical protein
MSDFCAMKRAGVTRPTQVFLVHLPVQHTVGTGHLLLLHDVLGSEVLGLLPGASGVPNLQTGRSAQFTNGQECPIYERAGVPILRSLTIPFRFQSRDYTRIVIDMIAKLRLEVDYFCGNTGRPTVLMSSRKTAPGVPSNLILPVTKS